jgi:predicted RNase H-like HicB family nuclease
LGARDDRRAPQRYHVRPTLEEARDLVRDALDEWLRALTSAERATIGADATRETLTLNVA